MKKCLQKVGRDVWAGKEGICQQDSRIRRRWSNCHTSAYKVREERERHPKSLLGRASSMGNEELPEHTLGCTAQRDNVFIASISAKPRTFSTPDPATLPDGIQEIYGVMTRSSTSRPTILHVYTSLASLPSIQWLLD